MDPKGVIHNQWQHLILNYEMVQASLKAVPFENEELKVFAIAAQLAFIKIFTIRFYELCFGSQKHPDEFSFRKDLGINLHFREKLKELRQRYAHIKISNIPKDLQISVSEMSEYFMQAEALLEDNLGLSGSFSNRHQICKKHAEDGWRALA